MTDNERYELDKKQRKEIQNRLESELDKWTSDISFIFKQWLDMIIRKKYPFVKGIADIREIGTHHPDKEHSIRIYLWTSSDYTMDDLKELNIDLRNFLKITSLEERILLDNEKWKMNISFFNVHDHS
jgi:hypothetical protein